MRFHLRDKAREAKLNALSVPGKPSFTDRLNAEMSRYPTSSTAHLELLWEYVDGARSGRKWLSIPIKSIVYPKVPPKTNRRRKTDGQEEQAS